MRFAFLPTDDAHLRRFCAGQYQCSANAELIVCLPAAMLSLKDKTLTKGPTVQTLKGEI
jgi:hypothetical protein